jgi:hypothetical protein
VVQGENGVVRCHPRAGKAHDVGDLVPELGLVAVDGTLGAGGLIGAVRAAIDTTQGVGVEIPTVGTRHRNAVMAGSAEYMDHRLDRTLLTPGPAGSIVSHATKMTGIIRNIPKN